jgi:DNA-binding Lrp family transcriptional regulator
MDAADLLAMNLPPLRWAVQDLIPEGTTILAAPPKVGKSCLVYQVAVEVSLGGELLGRQVESGSVLYLALEDGKRRGQERLLTALAGRKMPRMRLDVQWSARRIGKGLEEDLAIWLDRHEDARVVAVDTLQRVRPAGTGRRGAYEVDVEDLSRLQDLFRDRPTALVIVHHARKATSDDFLMSVSGTYGLTGSADTIVVIKRARLEAFGTITATGRDIEEVEISVRFDEGRWEATAASLPEGRFERAEVYKIIEEQGPIFPAAIAEQLGKTRQAVDTMVQRMVDAGDVSRTLGGYQITRVILSIVPKEGE